MTYDGLIGSGIPGLAVSAGSTAMAMGGLLVVLLVLTALVMVVADRRWAS